MTLDPKIQQFAKNHSTSVKTNWNGRDVKVGDNVLRMLAGVPQPLQVTGLTEDKIDCGAWEFDRRTGMEIDDYLGWGPKFGITGSFLVMPNKA